MGHFVKMSFMATTGFIVAGRGFEKMRQCIIHMFDGHAYSRALLLQTFTVQIIVTIPFQTTGARHSIDGPALNQIWSEMTT